MQANNKAQKMVVAPFAVSNAELPIALNGAIRTVPDDVIVAEGRDADARVAQAAIEASMTGHLIVSQLPPELTPSGR